MSFGAKRGVEAVLCSFNEFKAPLARTKLGTHVCECSRGETVPLLVDIYH
jgi:hypothetical protein